VSHFKVSGFLSDRDHVRLATIAAQQKTTRTEIASQGIVAILDQLENGGSIRLKRDGRIAANRKRTKKG
jgi:hypothetical protein